MTTIRCRVLSLIVVSLLASAVLGADVRLITTAHPAVSGSKTDINLDLVATGEVKNVVLSMTIPEGLTLAGTSSDTARVCTLPPVGTAGTITCSWPSLNYNQIFLDFQCNVLPTVVDGSTITVSASVKADGDSNAANDTSSATFPVFGPADLGIVTDAPTTFVPGTPVRAAFTVRNNGPSPARGVSILISEERTVAGEFTAIVPPPGVTCTPNSTGAVCSAAVIEPQATVTINTTFQTLSIEGVLKYLGQVSAYPDPESVTSNDFVIVNSTAQFVSDLLVTVAAPAVAVVGGSVPVAVTLTSNGPSGAPAARLQYEVPPDSTFLSLVAPRFGTCSGPAVGTRGTVTCTFNMQPPLEGEAFPNWQTLLVVIRPTASGTLTHTVSATTSATDPSPENNSARATTAVAAAASANADLSVSIAPRVKTALRGDDVTFDVQVRNGGPDTAPAAAVTVTVPLMARLLSASPSCSHGIDTVVCAVDPLAPGQTANLQLTAHAEEFTTVNNNSQRYVATVFGAGDANPANDSASAALQVITPFDLQLTKTVSPTVVKPGEVVDYVLVPSRDSVDVTIMDVLPPGTAVVEKPAQCSDGPTVVCSGVRGTIHLKVTAPSTPGPFTNTASISCFCDSDATNNSASATARVSGTYDLRVDLAPLPASVPAGEPVQIRATVTNTGTETAGSFFVRAEVAGGTVKDSVLIQSLAGGASAPLVFSAFAPTTAGPAAVRVFLALEGDTNPANDSVGGTLTVTAPRPADVAVSIGVDPEDFKSQAAIRMRALMTNFGPGTASNVQLRVPLPDGARPISAASGVGSCSISGTVANCTMRPIAPGETLGAFVTFVPPTQGPFTTTATITSLNDPVAVNNSASAVVDRTLADLAVSLTGPATAAVDERVVFTVFLHNNGPTDAADLALSYSAPPAFAFLEQKLSGAPITCNTPPTGATGRMIDCSAAVYPAGASTTLTLVYRAPSSPGSTARTSVQVSNAKPDSVSANDFGIVNTTVFNPPPVHRHAAR